MDVTKFQWVKQIQERYGVGRTKVFEAIKVGALPARKLGAATLIKTEDVEAFFDSLPKRAVRVGGRHGKP